MSNTLNSKFDCYILKSDPLWIFCYDKEEFSTKFKVHILNTAHTHTHLTKKKSLKPQSQKRANYFRVLILNISQEAMENGHKPSHICNELPILLFQLMLHWALVNKYCHQNEFTKHLERLLVRL